MNRADLRDAMLESPVWDTHTHVIGQRVAAR